jgi:hypothetical protein
MRGLGGGRHVGIFPRIPFPTALEHLVPQPASVGYSEAEVCMAQRRNNMGGLHCF